MIVARRNGFSIVEIMIAIAIIAVIAAIAYPSYLSQLEQSRRVEAADELASLSQAQERYYTRFRNYTSVVKAPTGCNGAACGLGKGSDLSTNEYYKFSARGNASTYTLIAIAHGSQSQNTDCRTLTIDQAGIRSATNANGEDVTEKCW